MQHPSSDEFLEEDSIFEDLVIPDAPSIAPKWNSDSSNEYKMPRQECRVTRSPTKLTSTFKKPEPVPVKRKRAHAETSFLGVEDKVAREKRRSSGYSRSHSANGIGSESISEVKYTPSHNYPTHAPSRQTKSSEEVDLARSFGTGSSASLASSRTLPSTGFNTPNTSFHTDSVSTSFDLGMEIDETTITLSKPGEIVPAGFNRRQRSTSEPPSSGITKSGIGAEECAMVDNLQRPNISPQPVCRAFSLIKGLKIEDYLERYLFQDSPFGKYFKPIQSLLLIYPSNVSAGRRL